MHTRGRPEEWRTQPQLASDELLAAVRSGLAASLAAAAQAGIAPESIVLDPGYGFGKRFDENYALLARQAELLSLGRPLLAGLSRKSFLGRTLAPLYGGEGRSGRSSRRRPASPRWRPPFCTELPSSASTPFAPRPRPLSSRMLCWRTGRDECARRPSKKREKKVLSG